MSTEKQAPQGPATEKPATRTLTHYRRLEERETERRPLDYRLISRLYEFTKPYAWKRNLLLFMVLIRSVQLPSLTWVIAAIIKGPITDGSRNGVFWGVCGFATLALSTQFILHFRQRLALELGEVVVHDLRNTLFAHLQSLPMGFFNRTKLGRIISRMTSDIENIRIGVQEVLFVTLVQLGQMGVAAAFMLWYDRILFLMVLGLAPVLWGISHHFHRKLSEAHRNVQESFSRVTATLAESVNGMRVTQGFVRQEKNAELFGELVADHASNNYHVNRTQGRFLPLLDFNSEVFLAALLLVGGYRVLSPNVDATIGDLVGFFFMANIFFTPIANLGTQYNQALTAMAGAERLFQLLDTQPDWSDPPDAEPLPRIEGRVECRDLTFSYLPNRPVLKRINFVAEPGQCVALVGHTGSGKTSIINLIAKFYVPDETDSGQVLIDGRDLRNVQTESLRRQIGVVLQTNFLFSGTVLDNIRMGKPSAKLEEIADAARQLECLDLLLALPRGLETQVGERGGSLSLGQRQLVCFARAMLADPRILILDEATSSIDPITEHRVQTALLRLIAGRTSFVVAHRLSTIRHADQVLVLDQGEIIERGTHDKLIAHDGVYAELYENFVEATAGAV